MLKMKNDLYFTCVLYFVRTYWATNVFGLCSLITKYGQKQEKPTHFTLKQQTQTVYYNVRD